MKATKAITTAGVGAAIVVGSMLAVNLASAQTSQEDRQAERASQLAEKLGVESSAVEAAFAELKEERRAEREAARAEFVAGLVSDGTLTQAQADQLTAFKDEFKTEVEALKESGAERDEIKAAMEENRAEIEAWAEAEGLNLDDIRPEKGEGRKGRRG